MGKYIFCICWALVYSHIIFGQSHGLGFSSHEVVPEKRTSLHLTPGVPVCLRGQTDLGFDLEFRPNMETYFGYVVRVITTGHQNIDLVYNQRLGVFHCVIGEKVTGEFRIDTLQLYRGWNPIRPSLKGGCGISRTPSTESAGTPARWLRMPPATRSPASSTTRARSNG